MTPIEITAKKATGDGAPLTSTEISAGEVRISDTMATRITPATGTRFSLSLDQALAAGTAPSRLKAKSMREQLVMQAVVQKNWPTVEIRRTVAPQREVSACWKIRATPPPPLVTSPAFCTAKRKARSRIQPPMAE